MIDDQIEKHKSDIQHINQIIEEKNLELANLSPEYHEITKQFEFTQNYVQYLLDNKNELDLLLLEKKKKISFRIKYFIFIHLPKKRQVKLLHLREDLCRISPKDFNLNTVEEGVIPLEIVRRKNNFEVLSKIKEFNEIEAKKLEIESKLKRTREFIKENQKKIVTIVEEIECLRRRKEWLLKRDKAIEIYWKIHETEACYTPSDNYRVNKRTFWGSYSP